MTETLLDAVVIGAGQAGLGISYFLKQADRQHIVFERGEIGETWRSQRFDSFALNTPNWANTLPGAPYEGDKPDGFWLSDELVAYFQKYVELFDLPIEVGMSVTAVDQLDDYFRVQAVNKLGEIVEVRARNVVVASGIMQAPIIPILSEAISEDILQLHTSTYRHPDELPQAAVVIVGGGQSGCQIAQDLVGTGRDIYLCSSKVGRLPRRYRGRETVEWLEDMGFWEVATQELEDPAITRAIQPIISGVGRYGGSLSLQHLARQGVSIVGRLVRVDDCKLFFDDTAAENVKFSDTVSGRFKQDVDDYLAKAEIDAPPLEADPIDEPDLDASCVSAIKELNLSDAGVGTIIWATGFTATFDWLNLPVLDEVGIPKHENGLAPVEGVYFVGFPWLRKRKSGIIHGIEDDARFICAQIAKRLD